MNSLNLSYNIYDKDRQFEKLVDSIENCRLCPDMECRAKVFSENNGNIYSNVLFIAEAPGRLGADRTRIPLFGDQTGVNFQRLINTIGWTRDKFFITNAILCNPRNEKGNNMTPTKDHIRNCSIYLQILINIMKPEFIITLGQKALESLKIISDIKVTLKNDVRKIVDWNGYKLIPLYHTGPRALVHRNYYNQLSDFYWIHKNVKLEAKQWSRVQKANLIGKIKEENLSQSKLQKLILEILSHVDSIGKFKLTKLLYLIDYESLKRRKTLISNSFYIRSYNGPIPVGLDYQLEELLTIGMIEKVKGKFAAKIREYNAFTGLDKEIIEYIINNYAHKTNSQIKTATYLTTPMKRILRAEKQNKSMLHQPVFSKEDFT